ncbi:MAG: GAF domain-containing protein [Acidobacteria bacterium]|nr:MAG: GAF domain-containing protein [Acidobacteriota bacterium]
MRGLRDAARRRRGGAGVGGLDARGDRDRALPALRRGRRRRDGGAVTEPKAAEGTEALQSLFESLEERSRGLDEDLSLAHQRLRERVDDFQRDLARAQSLLASAHDTSQRERDRLRKKAEELEAENRDFAQRYVELEDHSTSLTNLYAATFQLHSSLDPDAVVRAIVEIAVNLIGASEFVLYLADEAKGDFAVVAREGDLPPEGPRQAALEQAVERAALSMKRTVFLEETSPGGEGPPEAICCAPLYFRDRLVGALTIYALLSHKASFSQLDRELFDLLGEQAALAIVSSQAYVAVERKLKTVQRFMDLLKT